MSDEEKYRAALEECCVSLAMEKMQTQEMEILIAQALASLMRDESLSDEWKDRAGQLLRMRLADSRSGVEA